MVSCFGWQLPGIACPTSSIRYYLDVAQPCLTAGIWTSASWNGQRPPGCSRTRRDDRSTSQRPGPRGATCGRWLQATNACFTIIQGFYPRDVTISPDGRNVYVLGTTNSLIEAIGFYVLRP